MDVLNIAKQINNLRIVPRIIVAAYGILCWDVTRWFMAIPEPNMSQAAFVSTLIGAAGAFFGFYTNSGGSR